MQLADDARAAGPEGGADRDLALAGERPRQEQVRDVRAGDEQHEAHRRRRARSSERRTSPTTCSCSGTMENVRPAFGG